MGFSDWVSQMFALGTPQKGFYQWRAICHEAHCEKAMVSLLLHTIDSLIMFCNVFIDICIVLSPADGTEG